jgi:hypothetical protein
MIGHNEKTTSWGTGIEQMLLGFVKFTLSPYLPDRAGDPQAAADAGAAGRRASTPSSTSKGCCAATAPGARQFYRRDDPDRRHDPQRMPGEGRPAADRGRRRCARSRRRMCRCRGDPAGAQPRRQGVHRSIARSMTKDSGVPLDVKAVADDGTIEGYGSIFGNVDSYGEVVEPGAFTAAWSTRSARAARSRCCGSTIRCSRSASGTISPRMRRASTSRGGSSRT